MPMELRASIPLVALMILGAVPGCRERKVDVADTATPPSGTAGSHPATDVRSFAVDANQPEMARKAAAGIAAVLGGAEFKDAELMMQLRELAYIRNDDMVAVWASIIREAETGFQSHPASLDAIEHYHDKKTVAKDDPVRFPAMLHWSVIYLTSYDLPAADREVEAFLARFEPGHGGTEAGRYLLKDFRDEIDLAKQDRKLGVVPWKTGRPGPPER